MSAVAPSWTCPVYADEHTKCYFEQNVDEILVVTTKPVNGMFTWLRVYHSAQPLFRENEILKWALYTPDAEDSEKFVIIDKWLSQKGQIVQTRRTEAFRKSLDIDFKTYKQNKTESVIVQQVRLRRLYAKLKQAQSILTQKRRKKLKF